MPHCLETVQPPRAGEEFRCARMFAVRVCEFEATTKNPQTDDPFRRAWGDRIDPVTLIGLIMFDALRAGRSPLPLGPYQHAKS